MRQNNVSPIPPNLTTIKRANASYQHQKSFFPVWWQVSFVKRSKNDKSKKKNEIRTRGKIYQSDRFHFFVVCKTPKPRDQDEQIFPKHFFPINNIIAQERTRISFSYIKSAFLRPAFFPRVLYLTFFFIPFYILIVSDAINFD